MLVLDVVGLFWQRLTLAPSFEIIDFASRALGLGTVNWPCSPGPALHSDRDPHLVVDLGSNLRGGGSGTASDRRPLGSELSRAFRRVAPLP